jgi:hypothetical protein
MRAQVASLCRGGRSIAASPRVRGSHKIPDHRREGAAPTACCDGRFVFCGSAALGAMGRLIEHHASSKAASPRGRGSHKVPEHRREGAAPTACSDGRFVFCGSAALGAMGRLIEHHASSKAASPRGRGSHKIPEHRREGAAPTACCDGRFVFCGSAALGAMRPCAMSRVAL